MKKLTPDAFARAAAYLRQQARPLEQALFAYTFEDGGRTVVLAALVPYQNDDGGFGRALEPDMRAAASSVVATTIALGILRRVGATEETSGLPAALVYLIDNYDAESGRWPIISPSVEDAPHAPWWDYAESAANFRGFWANPRAAVVGYLWQYRKLVPSPFVEGALRAAAANLDQIVIVIAPEPPPHANLLDRYLAAAEDAGLRAVILLNKTDLIGDPASLDALLEPYRAIGYSVLRASAHSMQGLAELEAALAAHTTAFTGQSGVGKSSLIAALLPREDIRIGELSHAATKGRHTTTTARLYHLPAGGDLIDSPGIREFGLGHFDARRVARGFIEFRPWIGSCRFRDCRHHDEPGCALREAVAHGAVSSQRYASYLQIIGDCS